MARGRKPSAKRVIDAGFAPSSSVVMYGDDCTLPPPSVTGNSDSLLAWEAVVRCLVRRGDFDEADRLVISRYCKAYALACEAAETLEAGKTFQRAKTGWQQVSPAVMVFIRCSEACSKIEKQLGIGPEARRSLGRAADKTAPDELEEFLRVHA